MHYQKRYMITLFVKMLTGIVLLLAILSSCSLSPEAPKKYALIYGISKYIDSYNEGESPNLTYTDDDATAVDEMLKGKGYITTCRINSEATKENLDTDIETLKAIIKPTDLFLFYYSGHGMQKDNKEYILLYGSVYLSNGNIYGDLSKTYDDITFAKLLDTLPTNKRVVMLDSCNSGGFINNRLEYDTIPSDYGPSSFSSGTPTPLDILLSVNLPLQINNYAIKQKAIELYNNYNPNSSSGISPYDAIVISASGSQEYSYEDPELQHGLLTYFFLHTADTKYADLNGDGYVSTLEAFFYIKASIDANWNSAYYNYYIEYGDPSPGWTLDYIFSPHISGGPIDFVLFKASD